MLRLNPFKESDLNDLQRNIAEFITGHFSTISEKIKEYWFLFLKKGNERITLMFIPHSEKKIINFHISIFAISAFLGILTITIIITSILIISHSSTLKEVSKLKKYGTNSKKSIEIYKEEINNLYSIFQKFKPEITYLYSLTPNNDIDALWAKGGVINPNPAGENGSAPPIEILNIQEIEKELKTTKKITSKIRDFLHYRKKIIENTPSIWPVTGFLITRYGQRSSPSANESEFHSGIDIEAFPSAEIKVTAPGTVEYIKWDPVLGLTISIKHKYGFSSRYSHCQRVTVNREQKVSKGEVIGYVGRTGRATRYGCYYQVLVGTDPVDPMPYLNRISRF